MKGDYTAGFSTLSRPTLGVTRNSEADSGVNSALKSRTFRELFWLKFRLNCTEEVTLRVEWMWIVSSTSGSVDSKKQRNLVSAGYLHLPPEGFMMMTSP